MSANPLPKLPLELRHEPDPDRAGSFRVVDQRGNVWAQGIPTESAALLFAASPGILVTYDVMVDDLFRYFDMCWDIGFNGPDFEDFVEDQGELEDEYPGAPDYARWLQGARERSRALWLSGDWPIDEWSEPQARLF